MRPIDADYLKEEMDAWWCPDMTVGEIWNVIDRAPTFGGWISGCGMQIWLDGQWLQQAEPDEALCRHVRDSVRRYGMQVLYEAEEGILTDGRWSLGPAAVKESARMYQKGFQILEIDSLPAPRFVKFVTHDAPGCDRAGFLRSMQVK